MGRGATAFPFPACVLAVVLVLAGCSGLTGTESGTGGEVGEDEASGGIGDGAAVSVTPAPVPTVENTTASSRELAPGLSATGVLNPDALLAAHRRVLDADPYTVRAVVRVTNANGTVYSRSAATTRATERGERYYYIGKFVPPKRSDETLVRYESWSDGREILTAATRRENGTAGENVTDRNTSADGNVTTDGNTTYRRVPAEYERNAGIYGPPRYGERVRAQVSAVETAVRDRTDTVGPTYYTVSITGVRDPSVLESDRLSNARNVSGRLLVSPEGFVREHRVTFTATTPTGTVVRVVESIRYSSVGWTIVPRPPWYDAAIAATNETNRTTASAIGA